MSNIYLIGQGLEGSLSPLIWEHLIKGWKKRISFISQEVSAAEFPNLFKTLRNDDTTQAILIHAPYKKMAYAELVKIGIVTPRGLLSCNGLIKRRGLFGLSLIPRNTDIYGFARAFQDYKGSTWDKVLILGKGSAAEAAAAYFQDPTFHKGRIKESQTLDSSAYRWVINTTPLNPKVSEPHKLLDLNYRSAADSDFGARMLAYGISEAWTMYSNGANPEDEILNFLSSKGYIKKREALNRENTHEV